MTIRPIRNEAEYEQALPVVEALFDAQPGTAEGDTLDILTTLIEAYEQHHYPIAPADLVDLASDLFC